MTEVERVKPRAMFVEEAIQLALESRWSDAVTCNRRLIEQHGPDEEAYNRLGKALMELGELQEALDAYQETLKLNAINIIAPKMIKRITALLDTPAKVEASNTAIDVDLFTEEPGKSALTTLVAPRGGVVEQVDPGDAVELDVDGTSLRARTARGVELGLVDAKLARRLLPLIETGNRYSAAVARVDAGHIEVMLRETFQAPENARKTSFPIARGSRQGAEFRPYAKESLLLDRDDDDLGGEEDEESAFVERGLGGDDDLDAARGLEADLDEPIADAFDDDDEDDDGRPEDSY